MQLTRFLKLRKAVESLDPHHISKKLRELDDQLRGRGLLLSPQDTAITQDGIFYVEPRSGIATKVIAYVGDFVTNLTEAQRKNLAPEGYTDVGSMQRFHQYHLMRCDTLTTAEKERWPEKFRITRRMDGTFFYRIVDDGEAREKKTTVYQEIDRQPLYVCQYCLWKASSILSGVKSPKQETFNPRDFFDVNQMKSWNSLGALSKDFGFTKDMYPEDWLEICRVRKEQTNFHCEYCYRDLSDKNLRRFLHVNPTDHVENKEGYVRLECLCIGCIADLPGRAHLKERSEMRQFQAALAGPLPDGPERILL